MYEEMGYVTLYYDYGPADRSRCLSPLLPLPGPLPEPAHGQADGLLPKLPHDLLDPRQVGFGDGEVAPGRPHVVADFAGLGGGGVALRLHAHHVFPRVEKAPVIPIGSWWEKRWFSGQWPLLLEDGVYKNTEMPVCGLDGTTGSIPASSHQECVNEAVPQHT